MSHDTVLVVRTDSDGDVLLSGPAVRAVARYASVTLLVSPAGEAAARLLPGVDDIVVWPCPWSGYAPPPVDGAATTQLVEDLHRRRIDAAVVLTSYHQSPLPTALLLRLAGVPFIAAASEDYPGSLLDLRLPPVRRGDPRHEVERALETVAAAGFPPAVDDDGRLAVRGPLPWPKSLLVNPPPTAGHPAGRSTAPGLVAHSPTMNSSSGTPEHHTERLLATARGLPTGSDAAADLVPGEFVVVHPGASVPARAPLPQDAARIVAALRAAGRQVAVTGSRDETALTAAVAVDGAIDLGGRTTLRELAAVLAAAACAVVGNTGPAHLAAAVGTPVVSLFSPVVPAQWWAPWGVPSVVLGDQSAGCAGTRARDCPEPGHPCLASIGPADVVGAVEHLRARADRRVAS